MRKIEQKMVKAIRERECMRVDNTAVGCIRGPMANGESGTPSQSVRLHDHLIAEIDYDARSVKLSSCGWHTTTTKSRLNAVLHALGINRRLYQAKGSWLISVPNGADVDFRDGMIVSF